MATLNVMRITRDTEDKVKRECTETVVKVSRTIAPRSDTRIRIIHNIRVMIYHS